MKFAMKNRHIFLTSLALILSANNTFAAIQPDAGQASQNLKTAPEMPKKSPAINFATPQIVKTKSGGPQVKINSVSVTGNSVFKDKELLALLPDVKKKSYDLAGLQELANKITVYYRQHDYPFALAVIPEQGLEKGNLKIEIVEGRYDEVKIKNKNKHSEAAQKFLQSLKKDEVITGKKLERAILILDDQPGYKFIPVMSAGKKEGSGDLTLEMQQEKRVGGSVRVDNYGNRYMGKNRGSLNLYANSALVFGDQLSVTSIYTDQDMWYGSAAYNLPLGQSGLRGNIGYSKTQYYLGKEYSSLSAQGDVRILNAGLSYPIIRSQKSNLAIATNYQHKFLTDEQQNVGTRNKKSSDVIPLALNFDERDSLFGGGLSYGAITLTQGVLDLGNNLKSTDDITAKTDGNFTKINLDASRIQSLPIKNTNFFWRVAGQMANKNLDSSERFGLGGPGAVRAYPTGEAFGDEGILTQFELRHNIRNFAPYAFYDTGHIRTNHKRYSAGDINRSIGGGGVGLRFNNKAFVFDSSIAWRTIGGRSQSDSKNKTPQIWASLGYNF